MIEAPKNILLVGAGGKTGLWYCRLLLQDGHHVFAYDQNDKVTYPEDIINHPRFIRVVDLSWDQFGILKKIDALTLSPGVPLSQEIFKEAEKKGINIFSELEYCFDRLSNKVWICVTGTDGKSTTVAMIRHALKELGQEAESCGNYGLPFSQILFESEKFTKTRYLVAELSSYQLELSRNLRPDVSLYLNLAPDHLNRYDGMEHYGLVKWNIALNIKPKGLLLVAKNLMPGQSQWWQVSHPISVVKNKIRIIPVDIENLCSLHYQATETGLLDLAGKSQVLSFNELLFAGEHNYINLIFCLETMKFLKYEQDEVLEAMKSFRGLAHRFEKIQVEPKKAGKDIELFKENVYINDSKATTTQAVETAVKNVKAPFYLFMGGRSKGESYLEIMKKVIHKGATLFLFGENRSELEKAVKDNKGKVCAIGPTLKEVFLKALEHQKNEQEKKVTYLLSPASTSWDQYSSFEERGEDFRKMVQGFMAELKD